MHELEELAPEHALVKQMRALYVAKATSAGQGRRGLHGPERLDVLTEALRIWPSWTVSSALYDKAFAAEPTLEVAVTDVASPLGPWVRSPADARVSRLLYRPILASDDDDARQGKKPGQLAAAIEIVRPGPAALDPDPVGISLVRRLAAGFGDRRRARPDRPHRSAFAPVRGAVGRPARPRRDAPTRPGSSSGSTAHRSRRGLARWGRWARPTRASTAAWRPRARIGRWSVTAPYRCFVGRRRFRSSCACATTSSRRASSGQPNGLAASPPARSPRIKRIREMRLCRAASRRSGPCGGARSAWSITFRPTRSQGLADSRGDQSRDVHAAVVHVIALDGRNPALRNRALRRGLSYAIDRKVLLEDHVLKHPPTPEDTVADGPFPKGSYADAPGVKPLESHPWLAKMLVAAARKELGGPPIRLNFEYPAIPEVQAIVDKLADAFRAAGVEIDDGRGPAVAARSRAARRAGGSTWPIACCAATSRCSMPACCSVPATTPLPRPTPWPRAPAPRSCSSSCSSSGPASGRPRGDWPSRSIASRATSCR